MTAVNVPVDQMLCRQWWKGHLAAMEIGAINKNLLQQVRAFINDQTIFGNDLGDIRPGPMGRWDVAYLISAQPDMELAAMCGISKNEFDKAMIDTVMQDNGLDPDNPLDRRLFAMTHDELEEELTKIKKLLDGTE